MFARVLLLAALWCVLSGTAADNVTAVFGTLARVSRSRPSHLSFAPAPNPARFGSQPPPRVGSVAALTDNGTAVVFGGVLPSGALAAPDVWEYNAGAIATKSQSCPECTEQRITSPALDRWACLCDSSSPVFPPPRTGHTATYSQGKLVVYGGQDAAGELLRSVWVFDTLGIAWREAMLLSEVQPRPRTGHSAALMPTSASQLSLLVFGGASGTVVLDDIWQLSLAFDPAFQNVTGNWSVMRASDSVALSSDSSRLRHCFLTLLALPLLFAL